MRAFQLVEWQQPPVLRDVPVPEPGPGEVLVKIGGAGACHSDLHVMEWPAGFLPYELPFTLGHENAGWIEALGPGVKGWEIGEAVAVYGPWGCGRCQPCRMSLETLCERSSQLGAAGGGLGRDGGMAEYMLVPDPRLLVPLGDLDPRDAAPCRTRRSRRTTRSSSRSTSSSPGRARWSSASAVSVTWRCRSCAR